MPTPRPCARRVAALLLWLAASFLALAPATAQTLRVGVATMQPGEVFWERFGHDAIVVDDPAKGTPLSYNFGFFNPEEPDFLQRFLRGEMEYQLAVLPFDEDLRQYAESGRGVSIQWLALDDAQARRLADTLAENARPENARYRYDYFTDNCATRVRDALDSALGGHLHRQLAARSQGNTYRSEAVHLASPAPWMALGFELGLGPYADRPLSRWDDAFIPMRLAESLREVRLADGRPLVASEQTILPHRIAPEPPPRPQRWWPWLLAGLALSAVLWRLARRSDGRPLAWLALPLWTLCGGLGGLLLFIWFGTAHHAGWSNHNLLLLNPLCLLLLPGAWRMLRGRTPGRGFRLLLALVAIAAILSPFLLWLPTESQRNAPWIALLLPVHLTLWWLAGRPTPRAGHAPEPRHA